MMLPVAGEAQSSRAGSEQSAREQPGAGTDPTGRRMWTREGNGEAGDVRRSERMAQTVVCPSCDAAAAERRCSHYPSQPSTFFLEPPRLQGDQAPEGSSRPKCGGEGPASQRSTFTADTRPPKAPSASASGSGSCCSDGDAAWFPGHSAPLPTVESPA